MKKAIIFDLDGTLLNTLDDLADSVNVTLEYMNFPRRTLEEIRRFVGNGMRQLINHAVPSGIPEAKIEDAFDYFCRYYFAHCNEKTAPYDGIMQMLEEAVKQNYKLAVVSNKRDEAVKELCRQYFDMIEVVFGDKPGIKRKPAPDGVEYVLKQLDCEKSEAIYVGDSEVDILTARNAGVDCISVTWGFRTERELLNNGADVLVSQPSELLDKIRKFTDK
jgi:phosphoglycolate phosphatase